MHYIRLALTGAPLLMTVVFSVLGALGLAAGILGVALSSLVFIAIASYSYVLVDYTARGAPPPTLSIEMLSVWHEPRPLLQALVIISIGSATYFLHDRGWDAAAAVFLLVAIALLPASIAVLAVEGSFGRALWPPALLKIAHGLGTRYLMLLAATAAGLGLLAYASPRLPSVLQLALGQCVSYALATSLGGALYDRRVALGLDAWESPERTAAVAEGRVLRERQRAVDEMYALIRVGSHVAALERLTQALGTPPADPEVLRWFRDRAAVWDDRRMADRLTAELVGRLLALGQRGEALLQVEAWWRDGGQYLPRTARDLDVLKSVASEAGHRATLARLSSAVTAGAVTLEKKPD